MRLMYLVLIKAAYPMDVMFSYGFAGFNAGSTSQNALTNWWLIKIAPK